MIERLWRVRPGRECRFCGEMRRAQMVDNKPSTDGHSRVCRPCNAAQLKAWRERTRETRAGYDKEYYFVHWDRIQLQRSAYRRKSSMTTRRKHGITQEEKRKLLDASGWSCEICLQPFGSVSDANVDHDHACCPGVQGCSKCRRGFLCQLCNSALGGLRDSPELLRRAATYIEKYRKRVDA